MEISNELIEKFRTDPIPKSLLLNWSRGKIHYGREALVTKTIDEKDKPRALKLYATLKGSGLEAQIAYAKRVNRDEDCFYSVGLTEDDVPNSDFLCEAREGNSQLFAVQSFIDGKSFKESHPWKLIWKLITNRPFRRSLGNLFLKCGEVHDRFGKFPDLTGGDKVRVLGHLIPDPRKVINPLWTPNIMDAGNRAVLIDARTHDVEPGTVKYYGIKFHRDLTIVFGHLLNL